MKPVGRVEKAEWRWSTAEHDGAFGPSTNPRLCLTVVFSTTEGTLAALRSAGNLAKDLGARVRLVVPQVVPMHFSVDKPQIPIHFLERRQLALVSAAGIESDEVNIEIYLCRDRLDCLRKILKPPCLVIVGGNSRRWFSQERKLERLLRTLGHHVIFIEAGAKNHAGPLLRSSLRSVFHRVLDLHQGL